MRIRVIVVDHDGIVAGYYGPALDTRHNGRFPIAKSIGYFFFYGTYKLGTDDALVNKLIPSLEFTLSVQLRHQRAGAGTRSEERRMGKDGGGRWRARGEPAE